MGRIVRRGGAPAGAGSGLSGDVQDGDVQDGDAQGESGQGESGQGDDAAPAAPLRVLMVAIRYPEVEGGVDAMIRDLVGALGGAAEVEIFVPGGWDDRRLSTTRHAQPRHALRLRMPVDGARPLSGFLGWLAEFPGTLGSLVRLLRARRIDVIHLHTATNLGAYFRLAGRLAGVPYVVTLHGSDVTAFGRRRRLERRLIRWTLDGAAAIVAVSAALAESARARFALPAAPRVIRNGIDLEAASAATATAAAAGGDAPALPPGRFVLSAGALDHVKGHDLLIRAWAGLAAEFPDTSLVLAGEGDCGAEWHRLAETLGCAGRVRFAGALPRAQVLALMRRAALFVLPSRQEGLGIVLLEAGAAGCPVVAAEVGGVGEVVTAEETGLLVPPEDPAALAAAMRRLLADPALRDRLAGALQARVRDRFSSGAMARAYLEVYRECRRGRRPT